MSTVVVDRLLQQAGLPAVEKLIGHPFVFAYWDENHKRMIAGLITGIFCQVHERELESPILDFFVSIPGVMGQRIEYLSCQGILNDKPSWVIYFSGAEDMLQGEFHLLPEA